MIAKQKLHQAKLQEWTARFADQKASGLTVRQWCEINHFSFHTYNYWKHLLKEEVVDQTLPDIVPLSIPAVSDSDSSLEITKLPSLRSNRAIRPNHSLVKLGGTLCLKMWILLLSPVSTLSVVTQIFDMALIHLLPSLNANTI